MSEQDIDKILNTARDSLDSYCINTCGALCCKKGKLLLQTKEEMELIVNGQEKLVNDLQLLEKTEMGNITFNHEKAGGCFHLTKDNLCGIFRNPNKPRVCSDFPLFHVKSKNTVLVANWCPGFKAGLLTKYLDRLREKEVKVIE